MAYFMINNNDYSAYCNALNVKKEVVYNVQTNAAGDSVVDYINAKREIEVGIIPINDTIMAQLQADLDLFNVSISFRNPKTNALESVDVIIPETEIEYYTIQTKKVMYNEFKLTFIEL